MAGAGGTVQLHVPRNLVMAGVEADLRLRRSAERPVTPADLHMAAHFSAFPGRAVPVAVRHAGTTWVCTVEHTAAESETPSATATKWTEW